MESSVSTYRFAPEQGDDAADALVLHTGLSHGYRMIILPDQRIVIPLAGGHGGKLLDFVSTDFERPGDLLAADAATYAEPSLFVRGVANNLGVFAARME